MRTAEELVRRVEEGVRLDDLKERIRRLESYEKEMLENGIRFSDEEVFRLMDSGLHLFVTDHQDHIRPVLDMILKGSDYEVKTRMELSYPLRDDPREIRYWDLMVDVMKRGNIIPMEEKAIYCDSVWTYFENSDCWRSGSMILTPERIVLVGLYAFMDIGRATSIRIYYDDWESRPYLASVDFLYYKNIKSVQPIWKFTTKEIKIVYHTKYVRQKSQILYGPYFFKFNLGKSTDIREGDLNIRIVPPPYADGKKERHQATAEKLLELSGFGT